LNLVFFLNFNKKQLIEEQFTIPEPFPLQVKTDSQMAVTDQNDDDLRQLLMEYMQSEDKPEEVIYDSLNVNRFHIDFKPVKCDFIISQLFNETHNAIDIAAPEGEIVYAAAAGKIIKAGYDEYYGNLIIIDHLNETMSFYGHLSEIFCEEHYFVEKGDEIGRIGSTGYSTGPHLHFSIYDKQKFIDPESIWK
jgi:murein DD-endopeptidase MepM/ murein hydrolase activator NlpD